MTFIILFILLLVIIYVVYNNLFKSHKEGLDITRDFNQDFETGIITLTMTVENNTNRPIHILQCGFAVHNGKVLPYKSAMNPNLEINTIDVTYNKYLRDLELPLTIKSKDSELIVLRHQLKDYDVVENEDIESKELEYKIFKNGLFVMKDSKNHYHYKKR